MTHYRYGGLNHCCVLNLPGRPGLQGEIVDCPQCGNQARWRDRAWEWAHAESTADTGTIRYPLNNRSCYNKHRGQPKTAYPTRAEAQMRANRDTGKHAYRCTACGMWHVGSSSWLWPNKRQQTG